MESFNFIKGIGEGGLMEKWPMYGEPGKQPVTCYCVARAQGWQFVQSK